MCVCEREKLINFARQTDTKTDKMLLLLLDNAAADPFNSVGEMRARARVCVCVCVWLKQSSAVAHILHVCVRVDVVVCVCVCVAFKSCVRKPCFQAE